MGLFNKQPKEGVGIVYRVDGADLVVVDACDKKGHPVSEDLHEGDIEVMGTVPIRRLIVCGQEFVEYNRGDIRFIEETFGSALTK